MKPHEDAPVFAALIAEHYHGGQWSAMYAYLSSGTVVPGLASEYRAAAGRYYVPDDEEPYTRADILECAEWADSAEPAEDDGRGDDE